MTFPIQFVAYNNFEELWNINVSNGFITNVDKYRYILQIMN